MHIVLVDESLRHLDERDRARKASIVPPIGFKRGNIVLMSRVIYRGHHKVGTRMNHGCDVAVKTGESSLVLAHLLPVYPEPRAIIRGAYMQEDARVFLGLIGEVALIPDRPFIEKKRLALRVPVARHLQRGRLGEVVFGRECIVVAGVPIEKKAIRFLLVMKTEQAG